MDGLNDVNVVPKTWKSDKIRPVSREPRVKRRPSSEQEKHSDKKPKPAQVIEVNDQENPHIDEYV